MPQLNRLFTPDLSPCSDAQRIPKMHRRRAAQCLCCHGYVYGQGCGWVGYDAFTATLNHGKWWLSVIRMMTLTWPLQGCCLAVIAHFNVSLNLLCCVWAEDVYALTASIRARFSGCLSAKWEKNMYVSQILLRIKRKRLDTIVTITDKLFD